MGTKSGGIDPSACGVNAEICLTMLKVHAALATSKSMENNSIARNQNHGMIRRSRMTT